MFCDRCGTKVASEAQFCPSCGRSFGMAAPPRRSIASHIRILGVLWLFHGALSLFPGLFLMVFMQRIFRPPDVPPFALNFLPLIGTVLLGAGLLSGLAGAGLLLRKSWGRGVALVAGTLSLANVPFGTALGIYSLWALLPAQHEEEYRTLTQAV